MENSEPQEIGQAVERFTDDLKALGWIFRNLVITIDELNQRVSDLEKKEGGDDGVKLPPPEEVA